MCCAFLLGSFYTHILCKQTTGKHHANITAYMTLIDYTSLPWARVDVKMKHGCLQTLSFVFFNKEEHSLAAPQQTSSLTHKDKQHNEMVSIFPVYASDCSLIELSFIYLFIYIPQSINYGLGDESQFWILYYDQLMWRLSFCFKT